MKNMKKLFAMVLAVVMVLGMATMAMAENVSQAVVNNTSGHTYDAYQVLKGTQAEGNTALGDVDWGTGVKGEELLAELVTYDAFTGCASAADVAKKLESNDEAAKLLANIAAKHLTATKTAIDADPIALDSGYWLLIDTTVFEEGATNTAKNSALLQVTNNEITINVKYSVPEVDKDIIVEEDGKEVEKEADDVNIGDTVKFRLTGTLPTNYADYETYEYAFHDTMSAGLTLNVDSIVVKAGTTPLVKDTDYTVSAVTDAATGVTTLDITFADLKTIKTSTIDVSTVITVDYTAVLNAKADIGTDGNPNAVYLEYSNDPNYAGDGTTPTGNTPEDKVIVFTYELDVNKTDAQDTTKALEAVFVLYRGSGENIEYVQVDENGKVTGWTKVKDDASDLKSVNGKFIVSGLDAGTYYLEETKAPAGYNLLTAPIEVIITADVDSSEENPALKSLTITVDNGNEDKTDDTNNGDLTTGVVETTVLNNKGATLPETGGIGTTIFYILGGVMVVAAVVLLVTKRRMNTAE